MKIWKKIGIGLLAWGGYEATRLYLTAQDLIFAFGFPRNIKINFSAWTINFDIPVTFTNTKSKSIKINSLNLNVQTKGVTVGQAYVVDSFRIPANGSIEILIQSVVSIQNLISAITDIIQTISKPIVFNFSGTGTASNVFPFPINAQVQVTLVAQIWEIIKGNPNKRSREITQSSARSTYLEIENVQPFY
jgi:hypothetical protein